MSETAEKRARCGATFEHNWHAFQGERRRHVCDGVPRIFPPTPPEEAPDARA